MNEGLVGCGLIFGVIAALVAVTVAGRRQSVQVKHARYVTRVPTEESRIRQAITRGEVDTLADLPLVKKTTNGVQVWRGNKCTEYYTRGNELWQSTGKTARKIEDRFVLRQIMAELGEVEIAWE